ARDSAAPLNREPHTRLDAAQAPSSDRAAEPGASGGVEDCRCDQLLAAAAVVERQLELLGAPEVQLDLVLEGEADTAEHLLGHGGGVAVGRAGEELGHRGELGHRPTR